jgi:hypothetical protein
MQGPITSKQLPEMATEDILVLQGLTFDKLGMMVSDFPAMPLAEFFMALPAQGAKRKAKAKAKASPTPVKHQASAVTAHPWLAELTATELGKKVPELPVPTSPAVKLGPAAAELANDMSADDLVNTAWDQLTQKRQEWAADSVPHGDDFEIMLKGGGWWRAGQSTSKNFENIVAQAKAGNPVAFCKEYQLNKMASFSYFVYGENTAGTLASQWCCRMQHYYDIWLQRGKGYAFSEADRTSYKANPEWDKLVASLPVDGKVRKRVDTIAQISPSKPK